METINWEQQGPDRIKFVQGDSTWTIAKHSSGEFVVRRNGMYLKRLATLKLAKTHVSNRMLALAEQRQRVKDIPVRPLVLPF